MRVCILLHNVLVQIKVYITSPVDGGEGMVVLQYMYRNYWGENTISYLKTSVLSIYSRQMFFVVVV